ncbi:MAG: DNA polymerase III subunit chi [Zymomonas mobilis]|uniref:DNA polymerase III subunit chi n=1 Tax=Zymomonas mobilis TaxID=542 RepID=UPI0001B70390|nr:DNA polymerase III subunit chi [Zymomonas mobilis]ACV74596.1 DNA polymerase III chi subunit HolC [Zymomonas mobilis subsp. mobilis NCIMB 11163]AHB09380.1 DNA polymerase III, chi subunit [Zymomonas mobilis subsp. mobilis str. CP4 = NRRL B-14023]AHJ69686.1 DNA polymerase III subunit chi [Zymomonas mobilis subsp. mobilis NRRL B-12526]AHJ71542.1 DNA polymerase III subunit chi [Zymomonas mobilis subsp. mobilis str. CP4 = NRRL B-14023]ART94186.1 DNA polymerase III subunit chi [Zymomonas mobilis s
MVARVDFYHLLSAKLENILPRIAEKTLSSDKKLLVIVPDDQQARYWDDYLWRYEDTSFLPHGRVGGGDEAEHPVLISTAMEAVNQASYIALTDGLWRAEALNFERVFYFFDEIAVQQARQAWRSLKNIDGECHYWKQDEQTGQWKAIA